MTTPIPDRRTDVPAINPYAPSALTEPLDPTSGLGIGIWRSKGLIVVHEDALFPGYCIKSGQPASVAAQVRIRWSHWARWPRDYIVLSVAMNPKWAYWTGSGSKYLLLLGVACVCACLAAIWHWRQWFESEQQVAAAALVMAACAPFVWWWELMHPLRLVRRRRKYLWLRGAGSKFLEVLPPWPADV